MLRVVQVAYKYHLKTQYGNGIKFNYILKRESRSTIFSIVDFFIRCCSPRGKLALTGTHNKPKDKIGHSKVLRKDR